MTKICFITLLFLIIAGSTNLYAQNRSEEILDNGTLEEQYDYLNDRTNIYNNFRAVREDMFQKIRKNSVDSLNAAYQEINALERQLDQNNQTTDSLENLLQETYAQRDEAINNRDSMSLMGLSVNKIFYNVLLWSVIIGLIVLAVVLFVLFKRAHTITSAKSKELVELKSEFEEYKKTSRQRFEKQSIDHFNELRKLKGI